jgi:membrane fusion protein (multidrug efflux system)
MFLLIAIGAVAIWWIFYREYETTDDAYVGGNMVVIASRQEGCVESYFVEDTNLVKEGDVLVTLDPTDYVTQFEAKRSALAIAARQVYGQYEDFKQKKANLALQKAKYERAQLDLSNRNGLVDAEAISKEDYDHAVAEFKVAKASVDLARSQLEAARATLGKTKLRRNPTILHAEAELTAAYLAVQRCTIRSPVTGYVAKRNVQVGQSIRPGTPLMNVVPLNNLWVDANFKETQLEYLRIGQPVEMISDFYGSKVKFKGKIVGMFAGSGSVFALLPAQNATGNWIKIVQRVPIRISLDPEQVKKYPLVLGLSMKVSVTIADTTGVVLAANVETEKTSTTIYETDLEPLKILIRGILRENLGSEVLNK